MSCVSSIQWSGVQSFDEQTHGSTAERKLGWVPFSVIVASALMMSIPTVSFNAESGLLWLPQILTLLLLGVLGVRYSLRGRIPVVPPALYFYAGWVLLAGLSFLVVPWTRDAGDHYITLVKVFGMTVLFSLTVDRQEDLRVILISLLLTLPIILILNRANIQSYQAAIGSGLASKSELTEGRLAGTLSNANVMGLYGLIVSWASVTLYLCSRQVHRLFYLLPLPIGLYLIFLSGSRKGLIAIPLSILMLYLFYFRAKIPNRLVRILFVFPFIAAAVYFAADWILSSEQGYRMTGLLTGNLDSSSEKRAGMAAAGIRMFLHNPIFGIGFDQFRVQGWKYGAIVGMYSHSTFIEILAGTGLVGFLLYFGGITKLFLDLRRALLTQSIEEDLAIFTSTLWLLSLFVFYSLFSVEYDSKITWPLIGAFAGYAYRRTSTLVNRSTQ